MGVSRIRDEWAQVSMRKGTLSAGAALRLLPGARFYNCHLGGHLLAFFHASYKDQAAVCNQQSAVIHGGVRSIIADRFPFAGVDIKREGHRGGFGGLAVIADSVVVVRVVGSAGEINSACFFCRRLRSGRDAIAGVAEMRWKFRPFNFRDVALAENFSHPAFAGGDIFGIGAARVLVGSVDVNDGVADDGAGVTEYGRTGDRRGLRPGIFVSVVDLNVADRVIFSRGPSPREENVTVAIEADYGVVDGHGDIFAAVVAILDRDKDVQAGTGGFSALRVDDVP